MGPLPPDWSEPGDGGHRRILSTITRDERQGEHMTMCLRQYLSQMLNIGIIKEV
jgi:hypothetical protein